MSRNAGSDGWVLPAAGVVLVVLAVASLSVGDLRLPVSQVWAGLRRTDPWAATVIWQLRMPRLLVSLLVGAGLSASGLVMQAYFRNSLASPGLLGVSSGGAAGAVMAIAFGWASLSLWCLPVAAMAGAFAATAAVLAFARRGASTEGLILAGLALNALLGAVTGYFLCRHTNVFDRNAQMIFWLMGGLEDRTWQHVLIALPVVAAAALLWPLGRPMDLLSLGQAEAQSLGVDVRRLRRRLLLLSTVLAAVATAVAGSVGFVGLVVPHILRLLVGAEHRRLLPLSLVGGAVFVLACDLASRLIGGLPLGIVTALIGGPYFLWLLRRQR
ncbi:MAG TPA: iron ABC transporter permease [Opitutaceae bacterium]|jgi:iron complex transport system permease protein|nr:iron ABC transporter permease [Opitutaceae bacterium]